MKKIIGAGALVLAAALAASGCTPPSNNEPGDSPSKGSEQQSKTVKVMWNQSMYAYNINTSSGNATANANIVYMTSDGLSFYDMDLNLQPNKSFGTYEKVSDDPLKIKITIADTAQWSDGTPVTAADYLLNFGATSGLWNTVKGDKVKRDKESGEVDIVKDGVYFDSSSPSWSLITKFPEISEDGKTFTYEFSKPFADWETNVIGPLLPAHIVAKRALSISDAKEANAALVKAFKDKDAKNLSAIANVWNKDWNFVEMPKDKDLLVVNGPMQITDFKKGQYLTLSKNENYKGEHMPKVDRITVLYNEEPNAAVQALQNREVQLIAPVSTSDILTSLGNMKGVKVKTGVEGAYEHVDLTLNNNGPFDPKKYGGDKEKAKKVRQAFLHTVPREAMVTKIIQPLQQDAKVRNSFNVVPGSKNYDPTVEANGMKANYEKVDIDKAKALLKEAGVTQPVVRFMYAEGHQRRQQQFTLIKESAEKAGFKVVGAPSKDWGKKLGDGTYDAVTFAWQSTSTAVTEADANYRTGANNNFSGYSNPKVDKLYDELQITTDPDRQREINIEVEKMLVDDAFGITCFQFPGVMAHDDKLKNASQLTLSPTIFWNFWEWELS